jgi:hypothetical protein
LVTFNVDAVGLSWGSSAAFGIDDTDHIVGWAHDSSGVERAFVHPPGALTVRDFFLGHEPSGAFAINAGTIVGDATVPDAAGVARRQAFRANIVNGNFDFLGTLLPAPLLPGQFFGGSVARALSKQLTTVGISDALPPILRMGVAFGSPLLPFGPLPSEALGVASTFSGEVVVGSFWVNPPNQQTAGFMHDAANGVVDLNSQILDPSWHVDSATGINENGQICGIGTHATLGGPRGILLTP